MFDVHAVSVFSAPTLFSAALHVLAHSKSGIATATDPQPLHIACCKAGLKVCPSSRPDTAATCCLPHFEHSPGTSPRHLIASTVTSHLNGRRGKRKTERLNAPVKEAPAPARRTPAHGFRRRQRLHQVAH